MALELTDEQRAHMAVLREKWTAIGLDTKPIDKRKARAALRRCYKQIGRELPPITWVKSPREGVYARARWVAADGDFKRYEEITAEVKAKGQVDLAVSHEHVKEHLAGWADSRVGGNTWAGWHAWAEAMRYLGVEGIEEVDALNDLAQEVGWFWPYAEFCIVSEKPEVIRMDDRQRLHGEGVPAVRYRDGWSQWVWHGVDANEKVITGQFTGDDFLNEQNAEVRRVMAEVRGWEWVLDNIGAVKGAADEYGTKWSVDLSKGMSQTWGERDEALLVEVMNSTPEPDGSIKRYFLSVNPDECRDLSPVDCIGWTFSLRPGEYQPWVMS